MSADQSLLVELLRTAPAGPVLQLVGFTSVAVLWFMIETDRPATPIMKVLWGAGFVALAVGMHLTHRDARKIQAKRHARRNARAAPPWDSLGGGQ
jgi:hypothetical protein